MGTPGPVARRAERLDHCLERLAEPEFAEHLWTDHTTVPKTADRIAVLAGLTLAAQQRGRAAHAGRQAGGRDSRHIRLRLTEPQPHRR